MEEQPIILNSSKRLGLFGYIIVLAASLLYIIVVPDIVFVKGVPSPETVFIIILGGVALLFIDIMGIALFFPEFGKLTLTSEVLEIKDFFGPRKYEWQDIDKFFVSNYVLFLRRVEFYNKEKKRIALPAHEYPPMTVWELADFLNLECSLHNSLIINKDIADES